MRFSGIFQTISFTVRKRFVNAFLPSPYTVSKPSKNAPKTAKKIRNACGKNPHPLPPSCGSQSPKNRFVRPFFGILQVLALKTPARWPFSHSLCVFTCVPASGANVRPLLRTREVFSTRDCEKLSMRRLGRDMLTCSLPVHSSMSSSSSSNWPWSLVERLVSEISS